MGGRTRGAAPTPTSRLVAATTAVLAWTVATAAATPAGEVPAPPYASLVVGVGVLAALVTAAEIRRSHRVAARLAAGAVAAVVAVAQALVASVGGPGSSGRQWSYESAAVLATALLVLALVALDARRHAAVPDPVRPYAR